MSVTLLIDIYRSKRTLDYIHVDDSISYLNACRAIDKALNSNNNLNVTLHNYAQKDWFDQYKNRIKINFYDPCSEFANILGIRESSLPAEIVQDPKFVISYGLIEKAKPLIAPLKVESWILESTLDPIWVNEQIDTYDQLISVLLYLVKRQNLKIHPTLQALRNNRIAEWKKHSKQKKVIEWLFAHDPKKRAESILFAKLIWNYPHEIKSKALQYGNRWSDITLLEDFQELINTLPLHQCMDILLPPEIRLVINDYLNKILSSEKLEDIIGELSGITEEEMAIRKYLENYFDTIDESWNDTLLEISRIFSGNKKSESFISYLQKLIPIKKPTSISKSMSWDDVSGWLENEYFPYYRWCSGLGKINCTELSILSFEDWLIDNYYNLTKTKAYSPYCVQPLIASRVSTSPILHIIIDCLPWIYAQYIQEKLIEKGIESIDTTMHVTTIPTITRVAKPCLIRGQLPGQLPAIIDQSAKSYSELFAQSLKMSIDDVFYSNSNESDIASMITTQKKAYLFLDNEIDEMTHKPINPELRRNRIETHLNEIVNNIIAARENHKRLYGSELYTVISSDHGFTELPTQNNILTISESDWSSDHARILVNNDNKENPSPDNYIHITKEMLGGGNSSYYVARGFRTIGTCPKGATHGGITPQEVIVPVIIIDSSIDTTFKPLRVAINGEIRRGREKNNISIELFNNNSSPITVKTLDLRLITVIDSSNFKIPPGLFVSISATIDASRIKEEFINITGTASLLLKGRDVIDNLEYKINTIGAATSDKAFEDEFDV